MKEKLIQQLAAWGKSIQPENEDWKSTIENAYQHNRWFTHENITIALLAIKNKFLDESHLVKWLNEYDFEKIISPKNIGLILAGNIPLVGFHDLLCVMVSGHRAEIKLSLKDNILLPFLLEKLFSIDNSFREKIKISDKLKNTDAIIATGSNNSSRYFEYYFGKQPHIFRRNRSSAAVLNGDETYEDLFNLGKDIFNYFGLGCRNVSKLFIPEKYDLKKFFAGIEDFNWVMNHAKYKNNYDYNRTLFLMNKTAHLSNDFLMLEENTNVSSPVAVVHYEFYKNKDSLRTRLNEQSDDIQVICGNNFLQFGKTQEPELQNYADGEDVLAFLLQL
jgi:hypothetical protein